MSTNSNKKYQEQIDEPQEDSKELEETAASKNKPTFTHSFETSQKKQDVVKKKTTVRLKATKKIYSAADIAPISDDTNQPNLQGNLKPSNASSSNISTIKQVEPLNTQFMREFTHYFIKKDPNNEKLLEEPKQTYTKAENVMIAEKSLIKVKKIPKKTRGIFEVFSQSAARYVIVDKGYFYFMRKISKDSLIVCSQRQLSTLFKIYVNNKQEQELRLCFFNKERSSSILPVIKDLRFESLANVQHFLSMIKASLKQIGYSMSSNF